MKKRVLSLIIFSFLLLPIVTFLSSCQYLDNLLNKSPGPETYTVTFDSAGGSEVASITGIESGSTIAKPENPTKENYRFNGWYLSNNNSKWNFGFDVVTENINLRARWIKICTVSFDSDGAGQIDSITIDENSKITAPTEPTKEIYTFDGWYLNNTKWDFENDVVTEDITLKAKWSKIEIGNINEGNNKGSKEDPYYIYNAETFIELLTTYGGSKKPVRTKVEEEVNGEKQDKLDENGFVMYKDVENIVEPYHFKLLNDIDFANYNYTTIFEDEIGFIGILNGNGYSIKNISINVDKNNLSNYIYKNNSSANEYCARIAIFGTAIDAIIENITFENINVNVDDSVVESFRVESNDDFKHTYNGSMKEFFVSSVVAYAKNTILKANVTAQINSNSNSISSALSSVAGVVAYADATTITSPIEKQNAIINVSIICDSDYRNFYVSGVAGYFINSSIISHLTVNTNISAVSLPTSINNFLYIGGVAGYMRKSDILDSFVNFNVQQTEEQHTFISAENADIFSHTIFNKIGGIAAVIIANKDIHISHIERVNVSSNVNMDAIFGGVTYEVKSSKYTAPSINQETEEDINPTLITFKDLLISMDVDVLQVYGFAYKLYYTEIVYTDNAPFETYTKPNITMEYNLKMTGKTEFEGTISAPAAYLISENSDSNSIKCVFINLYVVYSEFNFGFKDLTRLGFYVGNSITA